ncbi:hypothetical protein ULMS_22710 [Patiriisocius marinistellae]|uniref:Uncharacterized protein n=1 Tax=Patiriisocius marinistellae TaxID=2494560 RepID=A0A5J4FXH9_9FLAO|nr:DUF6515 family protein [Patiriisocius marinistellae]GEQ86763.1 hypothetical protein ULMS_22710 [Patiriisocius marinistellae]
MKAFIKKVVLPSLFIVAFSAQILAQINRNSTAKEKAVKITNTSLKKANAKRSIPKSRVTYKTPQKKVVSVRSVPNKTIVKHNNQNYYYGNNTYYTQSRGRYIPVAPKVGFRIKTLPVNFKIVRYNNNNYYNAHGIFYIQINNQYEVIDPEIGTIVYELPDDYEKVTIDELTYYEYANILYEKIQVDDARAYEVVGIIEME